MYYHILCLLISIPLHLYSNIAILNFNVKLVSVIIL